MSVRILVGDCRDLLASMPDESVNCVVTSPPYWGLRDYGVAGQIGLEASLEAYLDVMRGVFSDVRRVLRKDGTLWLNLGDCYVSAPPGNKQPPNDVDGAYRRKMERQLGHGENISAIYSRGIGKSRVGSSANKGNGAGDHDGRIGAALLKSKDLVGIPWRVAFALQADGWYLRQDIIWSKPNPMPESVRDRCTKAHEYLFLLSKSERYYYDADAIKEPASYDPEDTKFPDGWDTGAGGHGSFHRNGREKGRGSGNKTHKGVTEYENSDSEEHRTKAGLLKISDIAYPTRNKRSVWTIGTQAFPEAHFATFPPALIEPCIKAGCPQGGTVLDPFGGAGTTGLVADRLQRDAILIELNPDYAAMAERRIRNEAGMLANVVLEQPYDGNRDFAGSIDECLSDVRARVANGGEGWRG